MKTAVALAYIALFSSAGLRGSDHSSQNPAPPKPDSNQTYLAKTTQSFESPLTQARRYMKRKDYRKAQDILRKLAENNKTTELYLLSGEVAYHLKKYKIARKLFDKVPPILLSGSNAYAYGYSHLKGKNWQEAIVGFRRVSKKSKYRGLAAYYIGFCYFKLEEWDGAKKFLKQVDFSKLPQRLQLKRDQLLQLIEKKQDREAQEILAIAKVDSEPKLSQGIDVDALLLPDFVKEGEDEVRSDAGRFYKVKALLTHQQLSRKLENHGFVNLNLNVGATKLFSELSAIFFKSSASKLKPGLQAGAGYSSLTATADEASFVSLEGTTGAFAQLEQDRSSEAFAVLKIQPFLNYQFSSAQSIQASVLALQYLSQKADVGDWSIILGKLFYKISTDDFNIATSLSQRQRQDDSFAGDTAESVFEGLGGYRHSFAKFNLNVKSISRSGQIFINESPYRDLLVDKEIDPMDGYAGILFYSGTVELTYKNIDAIVGYTSTSKDSPAAFIPRQSSSDLMERHAEQVSQISGSARLRLFGSLSISARVYQSEITSTVEEVLLPDGTLQTFQADVTQLGAGFSASFSPFDWLQINGSYGVSENSYTPINFLETEDFYKSVPDFVRYTLIQAKFSYEI